MCAREAEDKSETELCKEEDWGRILSEAPSEEGTAKAVELIAALATGRPDAEEASEG